MTQHLFLVDVEASGKSPYSGVMTEFGVVEFDTGHSFHGHLWDSTPDPVIPAIPVPTNFNPGFTATAPGNQTVFGSRWNLTSFGAAFVVSVVPDGAGALLQLTVDNVPDAPKALLDGWQNGKAADKFIAQVTENLTKNPRPKHDPVESWQYAPDGSTIPWTSRDFPA